MEQSEGLELWRILFIVTQKALVPSNQNLLLRDHYLTNRQPDSTSCLQTKLCKGSMKLCKSQRMITDRLQKVASDLVTVTLDFMQLHGSVERGPIALGPAAPKTVMVV